MDGQRSCGLPDFLQPSFFASFKMTACAASASTGIPFKCTFISMLLTVLKYAGIRLCENYALLQGFLLSYTDKENSSTNR